MFINKIKSRGNGMLNYQKNNIKPWRGNDCLACEGHLSQEQDGGCNSCCERQRRSTACVSPTDTCDIITLPTPASSKAFNKIEVLNLMSKVTDCHIHAATAKATIKHKKQYHVSLSKASIYRMLANHANGSVISGEFTGKG